MAGLRVLTFNFHEPYLWLMAKTGLDFTVGQYRDPPLARAWHNKYRPTPTNMSLVDEPVWKAALRAGDFDVVVAQNETNAATLIGYDVPKLLVCHNRKTFLKTTVGADTENPEEAYEKLLQRLQEHFRFVFISASKRGDYGIPGDVVLPGIDVDEFGGYTGEIPKVLRVGNMMRDRDLMFDVEFQEKVCQGVATRVAGFDPLIPGAEEAESFEDLLRLYRAHRCYLHVTRQEYEDGYNLALLEAMACGMPIVSLANRTSPLTDGVDGFVSEHAEVLRGRVWELMDNDDLARAMGVHARETVAAKFPITAFVEDWRRVIEEAAEEGGGRPRPHAQPKERSLRVALHYVASPITTGRYIERALRKRHDVVTAGFRCPEEVLELWGFAPAYPPYPPHDVDLPLDASCADLLARWPRSDEPEAYLWIDSGPSKAPPDLETVKIPKASYLIDTHIAPELRLEMGRHFDFTFLAQKAHVAAFREAGIANVSWLPLACCPGLHDLGPLERVYDVAYVGSLRGDPDDRRQRLLQTVAERFPNSKIGQFWPEEMARIYAQSRIVVNACVSRDVNMRVFEALASGALLITDEADGLEDLFEDGTHFVVYRNDAELPDLVDHYLQDSEVRERIAAAGTARVRERHTYDHRVGEILRRVTETAPAPSTSANGRPFDPSGYYGNVREEIAQFVPTSAQRLLDVGCGTGELGAALKRRGLKEAYGVEAFERAGQLAAEKLDGVLIGDVEAVELPYEDGFFDCIIFADVLEHLVEPEAVLRKAARVLGDHGVVIMSIPNVRFCGVLAMLGEGRWEYADAGILDRSHLRFFTAEDMRRMVEAAGFEVLEQKPLSTLVERIAPREPDGSLRLGRLTVHPRDEADYQDLLTYQYLVIAGKPGVDRLERARQALELGHHEAAVIFAEEAYGADAFERARLKAKAAAKRGKLTDAEKLCREALELRPEDADALGELGIVLVAMNRAKDARPFLLQALERAPENERLIGALGLVLVAEGRLEEAFASLTTALEASFEHSALLPHLIETAGQLGRLPRIEALARRYADFYPANADLVCEYAELLVRLGNPDEARARLDTILMLAPEHEKAKELLRSMEDEAPG